MYWGSSFFSSPINFDQKSRHLDFNASYILWIIVMYFTAMTFSIFWSLLDSVWSSSLFTVLLTFLHEAHRRQINTLDSLRDTCHVRPALSVWQWSGDTVLSPCVQHSAFALRSREKGSHSKDPGKEFYTQHGTQDKTSPMVWHFLQLSGFPNGWDFWVCTSYKYL